MARKPRMTVFSKFMLLMLFVGPLSYMAASYYNGENGVENIKNLVNKGKEKIATPASSSTPSPPPAPVKVTEKEEKMDGYEIQKLKRQLEDLDAENRQLKRKIKNLEAQLK